jgi:hypothetical protein
MNSKDIHRSFTAVVYNHRGMGRPQHTVENFWRRVRRTRGCWFWTGSVTTIGYGRCRIGVHTVRTHRLAYELAYGPIPNGHAVLTPDAVLAIRERYVNGAGLQREIAADFGVSQLTISNIVTRKTWRHL